MGLYDVKSGFNSATEFMVSGLPWVTSSIASSAVIRYSLPKISKHVILTNHDSTGKHVRLGFTSNGVTLGNYFKVDGGQSLEIDVRVKDLYLVADNPVNTPPFSLFVELTGIDPNMMPVMTGSISGTAYWEGVG